MGCVQSKKKLKRKITNTKLKKSNDLLKTNLIAVWPQSKKKLKTLTIEHICDQTDTISMHSSNQELKKLKSRLDELQIRIEKINTDITNGSVTIYDYCSELKRLVQLRKEKQIAKLKALNSVDINTDDRDLDTILANKIQSINIIHQKQIEKIEIYEKKAQNLFKKNSKNCHQNFLNEIHNMNTLLKNYTNDFSLIDSTLDKFELDIDDLIQEVHLFIFNNNLLEFDTTQDDCIKSKEFINFKTLDLIRIPYESLDNSGSFAKFDLLDSENYLVTYKLNDLTENKEVYHRGDMTLLLFSQNELKLKKRIIMRDCFIGYVKHVNNSIAIQCSTKHAHLILVFDNKLNLKHKIDCKSTNLVAASETRLYCSDFFSYENLLNKSFDWTLKKCNTDLKIQLVDSSKPFYIEQRPDNVDQIELSNHRYFISYFKSYESKLLVIFDTSGRLVKQISIHRQAKFKCEQITGNLVVLENDRLFFYDLNGNLIKSKELLLTKKYFKHMSNFKFIIDKKNCLHILNAFNLNIYKYSTR